MIAAHITAWNYKPLVHPDEQHTGEQVFNTTINDAEQLYRQFGELPPGDRGGAMSPCYAYEFLFAQDGQPLKVYAGLSNRIMWSVKDVQTGADGDVRIPDAILTSLHESIGLPVHRSR